MALETKLAEDFYDAVKLRDVEGNYHKMTYRALLEDFPGIDWGTVMLLNGIPSFENICVGQPEAIRKAEKILAEESIDDLKVYLTYKVLDNAASSLSDRFREATFNFYQRAMSGAEQDKPRWKRGIDVVNHTLGMAIGKVYVEKYFPETSKQRMTELVRNLQHALGERIDAQKWMSPETKQKAHEKLNAFRVKIGYPDTWMDYSKLDIDDKLSFYENLLRARRFMSDYYVEKRVNKRVDRDEWLMTPQTVNAYYNPTTNEICFPAGILQPPFFQADADDACNYGAIGVVIGHARLLFQLVVRSTRQEFQLENNGHGTLLQQSRSTPRTELQRKTDAGREHRRPRRTPNLLHRTSERHEGTPPPHT